MMNEDTFNIFDDFQQESQGDQSTNLPKQSPFTCDIDTIAIRLELLEATGSIRCEITDEVVIGRKGTDDDPSPEIDLSPYTGYQLGISRRHLLLRSRDGHLEAQDLGSRNGTFINGYRISPDETVKLAHQDEIRLGRLVMILHIE